VLGRRMGVGVVVLVNGLTQTLLAIVLGHRIGIIGVAWASVVASALTSLPAGIALIRRATSFTPDVLVSTLLWPWFVRMAPIVGLALIVGISAQHLGLWAAAVVAGLVCAAYVWQARPLLTEIATEPRFGLWLRRLRLVSPPASAVTAPLEAVNEGACR
jgi:hypothetical protein